MNILIIGAGISGLSLGQLLLEKGFSARIIEADNDIGGLVRCDRINGFLYHRVGGHVFNSKSSEVTEWFWSFFDREKEFVLIERNAKILLDGKYVGYPLENHIHQLDEMLGRQIVSELITTNNNRCTPSNFADLLRTSFGNALCELYFFPYNDKLWHTELDKVPLDWLEGKLPRPDVASILSDNIFRAKERKMVHSNFYYPVSGGSQFICNRLAVGLDIETGTPAEKINLDSDRRKIKVNGEAYDRVVYTGDIRKLHLLIETDDQEINRILHDVSGLQSRGTSNLLCECDPTDMTWLYLPATENLAHRIIYTGEFVQSNNGDSSRSSCTVEFSGFVSEEIMRDEALRLPGNLRPVASNYQESSYIMHDTESASQMSEAICALNEIGIFPLGRFAEWQYYNMDKAIESAMKVSDALLSEL